MFHQCWAEEQHHLPRRAGDALPSAAQEAAVPLCCGDPLLAHGQLVPQDLSQAPLGPQERCAAFLV